MTEPESDGVSPLDADEFLQRVRGDIALAGAMAQLFCSEYPRQLDVVRRAIATNDASAVEQAVHALRGAVMNFSAEPAAREAARLEVMGRTGDLTGAVAALRALEAELDRLALALREMTS